jgi:hypothetical protein
MDTLIRMIQRRDTAANWSSANPVLEAGEFGYDTTNKVVKIGDGSTCWNALTAITGSNVAVGNGTITIKQGGVTKGTFTVNQSGNTTVDLEKGGTTAWGDITGKPQIGSGTVTFKDAGGTQFGKVPLNSTNDIEIKFPVSTEYKPGKGIIIEEGQIMIDENYIKGLLG